MSPEEFVTPEFAIASVLLLVVMVYELVPLKVILRIWTKLERDTEVVAEVPKMASDVFEFGTLAGFQFVAVFQSPLPGLASHVWALTAHGHVAQQAAAMEVARIENRKRRVVEEERVEKYEVSMIRWR